MANSELIDRKAYLDSIGVIYKDDATLEDVKGIFDVNQFPFPCRKACEDCKITPEVIIKKGKK